MKLLRLLFLGFVSATVALSTEEAIAVRLAERMQAFAAQAQQSVSDCSSMQALPQTEFDPTAAMPEIRPGESAVVADGGLYFDGPNGTLTYIGNVRLNDEKLQLRAAEWLYLVFPKHEHEKQKQQKESEKNGELTDTPSQSAPDDEKEGVLYAVVQRAAVDLIQGDVVLEGGRGRPSLRLARGADFLLAQPRADRQPAQLFYSGKGDMLLLGTQLEAQWHDRQQGAWFVKAEDGPAVLDTVARTLTVYGDVQTITPRGTLNCTKRLVLTFSALQETAEQTKGTDDRLIPYRQNMRLGHVESVQAEGDCRLMMPADGRREPVYLCGDFLNYSASGNTCRVEGAPCTVQCGNNTICTDGTISSAPSGDIVITGSSVFGTYSRPIPGAQQQNAHVCGTFSTVGPVSFIAAQSCIHLPAGVQAQDSLASFSSGGTCDIYLTPPAEQKDAQRRGVPDSVLPRSRSVERISAVGGVEMRSRAAGSYPAWGVHARRMQLNLRLGTAHLYSECGQEAAAQYGAYVLRAQSVPEGVAELHVPETGDVLAKGTAVNVDLPAQNGTAHIACREYMQLHRGQNTLVLGPGSQIRLPAASVSARGPLFAHLAAVAEKKGERAADKPHEKVPARFPHLVYNFSGLDSMETHEGGSLRSAQVSMQCEREITLGLSGTSAARGSDLRNNLRFARATGRVRLIGRDAANRLVRADGEQLEFHPADGNIVLSGPRISLRDVNNVHTATGAGARIIIDPHNNVTICGKNQTTIATRINEQIDKNKPHDNTGTKH